MRRLAVTMALAILATLGINAVAEDAATNKVTKDLEFVLRTTTVLPQAIVSSTNVADAAQFIKGKPVLLKPDHGSAEIILDFGRELVGTIEFNVNAQTNSRLEVWYGEGLQEVFRNGEYAARWYKRPRDHMDVPPGPKTLHNQGRRAFRYIRMIVPDSRGPLSLESVVVTHQHYPVNEAGSFSCSDEQLNRIWGICAYTTKLCMQQWYEDGIKRDGLLWVSDYRVQYLCNALTYGDGPLARKSLLLMAASQFPDSGAIPAQASRGGAYQHPWYINYMPGIPRGVNNWILVNYSLDYIGCVRDYYRHTGDRETVAEVWPAVQKLIPFLMKQEPLKLGQLGNFITDGRYNESWWGSHGTLEMQFAIGIEDAAYLAKVMGDDAIRKQCEEYLPRQRERIQKTYFDKNLGFYLDEPAGTNSASWHANSFALLAGIGDYKKLSQALEKATIPVRPATAGFMLYWTMEAKFRAGLAQAALDDIRKVYGHMLGFGATTTWEKCDLTVGDHPNETEAAGSRCHGWSAGPANLLPAHILGVQPGEPGFATVRIEPNLCDLKWAEGVIPTPKGLIKIRWEQGTELTGTVTLPQGMTGEASVAGRTIALKPGENAIKRQ